MEKYPKIQSLFKRDLDGSRTGKKGRMIRGEWTTPELEYLAGNEWEFTEKTAGMNVRIGFHQDGGVVSFGGRSDSATIPTPLLRYLEETFTEERFENAGLGDPLILFGEGYGPKIQGGDKYRDDHSFVLFDVKIGGWWLARKDVDDIASKLGIDSVPAIGYGTLGDAIDIVSTGITFEKSGGLKRWGRGTLYSQWGDFPAEGIVARPVVPVFDRKGQRIITKVKGVDFK